MATLSWSPDSSATPCVSPVWANFWAMPPKVGVKLLLRCNCTVGTSAGYRLTSRYWLARCAGLPALSSTSTATV